MLQLYCDLIALDVKSENLEKPVTALGSMSSDVLADVASLLGDMAVLVLRHLRP